jgi:hypothetical protein
MRKVIRVNETVKELPGGIDLHGRRQSRGAALTLADQTIE